MEAGFLKNHIKYNQKGPNASSECICYRPHSNIICNGCGFWTKGRVRYYCPQHPQVLYNKIVLECCLLSLKSLIIFSIY